MGMNNFKRGTASDFPLLSCPECGDLMSYKDFVRENGRVYCPNCSNVWWVDE